MRFHRFKQAGKDIPALAGYGLQGLQTIGG
jgi:hypothetical protein